MADKQDTDLYATELARRFEELTQWAIEHWPYPSSPLTSSDFEASRKEFGALLGARLSEAGQVPEPPEQQQYVQVNPAPWP
jgi:hypothetical protein